MNDKLMKTIRIFRSTAIAICISAATVSLPACSDNGVDLSGGADLEPGTPVEVSIAMSLPEPGENSFQTRASTGASITRQTYDLYLFIFNEDNNLGIPGTLKTKYYFPEVTQGMENQCDPAYSSSPTGTISSTNLSHIHTTAGKSRIVAVANCDRIGQAMLADKLNSVTTFDQLKEITVSAVNASGEADVEMPISIMSGYFIDSPHLDSALGRVNGVSCEIGEEESGGIVYIDGPSLSGQLVLTPLRSRVKFIVYSEGHPADTDSDGNMIPEGKFELASWQVVNIPSHVPLFCNGGNPSSVDMLSMEPSPKYESGSDVIDETGKSSSGKDVSGFSFFISDNHPGRGKFVGNYSDRGAWDISSGMPTKPEYKKYTNAPAQATFVILRGRYTGASLVTEPEGTATSTSVRNVSTEVTYTVFLGHDSQQDFSDYNIYRNFDYTYVLRIKGINTITVEVNRGVDNRPDYEGHVVASETPGYILDAHFEQRTVDLSKENILANIRDDNLLVSVSVPLFGVENRIFRFCDKDGNIDISDPEGALPYMQWIEFYRHSDIEQSKNYIPYTQARGTAEKPATMGVTEFMKDLYDFAMDPSVPNTATRRYTLYFDEYLYDHDPADPSRNVTWQELLRNGQPRTFTMLGSTVFSKDGNSSYSTQGAVFSQKCMETVYNLNEPSLKQGWATECIAEDLFSKGDPTIPFGLFHMHPRTQGKPVPSSIYGIENCWSVAHGPGNTLWHYSNQIDGNGYMLKPQQPDNDIATDVVNLFTTCMQRNRDLNGNGLIDSDELRWYVPSLNQMEVLYIGQGALSPEVTLYNPKYEAQFIDYTNGTYPLRHYITSQGDQKFWAEEGSSNSKTGLRNPPAWNRDSRYYLRCVRDLGTGNDPAGHYEHIYTYQDYAARHDMAGGLVRMSNLSPRSRRNYAALIDTPGLVNTFSESSFPAYEFEWADTVFHSSVTIAEDFAAVMSQPQQLSECGRVLGKGWRLPTLAELTAIYWAMDKDGNRMCGYNKYVRLGTRTQFYYKDKGLSPQHDPQHPRQYHMFDKTDLNNSGQFTLNASGEEKEVLYMRCVRDYTSGK